MDDILITNRVFFFLIFMLLIRVASQVFLKVITSYFKCYDKRKGKKDSAIRDPLKIVQSRA